MSAIEKTLVSDLKGIQFLLDSGHRLIQYESRLSSSLTENQKRAARICGISEVDYALNLLDCYQQKSIQAPPPAKFLAPVANDMLSRIKVAAKILAGRIKVKETA